MKIVYIISIVLLFLSSCTPSPHDVVKQDELPPIYPDYCDVTIPQNIAPLNFLLRADCEAIEVKAGNITLNARGNEATFDMDEWKDLLKLVSHSADVLLNEATVPPLREEPLLLRPTLAILLSPILQASAMK